MGRHTHKVEINLIKLVVVVVIAVDCGLTFGTNQIEMIFFGKIHLFNRNTINGEWTPFFTVYVF